jgi:hypothetical protein
MSEKQRNMFFHVMREEFEDLCKKRQRQGYLDADERLKGQEYRELEEWASVLSTTGEETTSPLMDWWDYLVMTETHFGKEAVRNRPYFVD